MIQANELRRGNWVGWKEPQFPVQVTEICETDINLMYSEGGGHTWCYELESCVGIPLTPEILEKCGFVFSKDRGVYRKDFGWHTFEFDSNVTFVLGGISMPHINNVHTLQNIFFSLTNTELTVNL